MTRKETGAPYTLDSKLKILKQKQNSETESVFEFWLYSVIEVMMDVEKQNLNSEFPFWKPISRRFQPDSLFFAPGNVERELLVKQVLISISIYLSCI